MSFRVGDRVRIKTNATHYRITIPGSEWIVQRVFKTGDIRVAKTLNAPVQYYDIDSCYVEHCNIRLPSGNVLIQW